MINALYTAGTGMDAQQTQVDVIANNLANVNTTGFKRSQVTFKDLLYIGDEDPGTSTSSSTLNPTGSQVGTGVEVDSIIPVFTQGVLEPTGRDLDIAIQGDGFFQVQLPNGTTGYTRAGAFTIDVNGNVVNGDGFLLQPATVIPSNTVGVNIGKDGTVSATQPDGTSTQIGTIQLVRFVNPAGLRAEGGNIFTETTSSGAPTTGTPGVDGIGALAGSFLERSNVQVVNEMVNLIVAQRAYEFSSKAISSTDQMLLTVNNIVR